MHEVPIEPPPSRWALPDSSTAVPDQEIVGVGADLAPGTLLAAYRQGLFPMRLQARGPIGLGPIGWWSPDPRGVIPLDGLIVSRSLRRSSRRFEIRVDTAFEDGHARLRRSAAAARLDRQEVHRCVHGAAPPRLGAQRRDVAGRRPRPDPSSSVVSTACRIGGLFAAESKFHRVTDASKVAVVALVDLLRDGGGTVARRAVDDASPRVARRGRRAA